ncbi:LA_3751/LA_3752 family putative glycosyltransferase [Leptospira brenneri]|uniref:LA_3751/LA_3752 family putative glycosyltransferase n=1 Tax=Leptospira brenneri TaxID=2023182 RepID=UPI000C2AC93E|nr:hypothetical protein [Leptospira brenneri]PJZ45473.1 hypothetical protein CH361_10630 [Leptospira brenneri]
MNKVLYWIERSLETFTNKNFIIFVLVFFIGYLFYKRVGWDSGLSPLIQSDSQIKLYQTIEYKVNGLGSHQCYSKYKEFDENYRFYPFRYPWTYFTEKENGEKDCVFQYPSFFSQSFSLLPIPYRFFNGVILLLYLILSFSVILCLFYVFGIQETKILGLGGILYLVGYGISSAIEFSESIPSQLLLLSFFYAVFLLERNEKLTTPLLFFFGLFGGVSVFLRSESIFFIGVLGVFVFFRNRTSLFVFLKKYLPLVFGLVFALILFGFYNYFEFQEIFGVRSRVSFDDFSRLNLSHRFHLVSEFFFGNTDRIGFVFYCFPLILLVFYSILKLKLTYLQKLILYVNLVSFFLVVLLSPYSSGGLYLGLRFTEFSYLLFCIFGISLLGGTIQRTDKSIVMLLILLQVGFGFYHVRRNFKTIDYVKRYHDIFQSKLDNLPDAPVVHLSTFDLLLVSDSFLKKPHWITNSQKEFSALELKFLNAGINKFQVFFYNFKPPKDDNSTEEFYNEWINTKFEIKSKYYKKVSDEVIAGFRFMVWEKE